MFDYCVENLSNKIKFFYTANEDIEAEVNVLNERFMKCILIPGTLKYHKFIPMNEFKIKVFEISSDGNGVEKYIQKKDNENIVLNSTFHPNNGDFIICNYNQVKWVGFVDSYDDEFGDFGISFLYPSGYKKYYYFPEKEDFCHIIKENILGILCSPNIKAGTTRIQYAFDEAELKKIMKIR